MEVSEKRPFKASDTWQRDFIPCPSFGLAGKDAKIYDFEEENSSAPAWAAAFSFGKRGGISFE